MPRRDFDFYSIGDSALELSEPRSNLRHYIDLGLIPARRASDGSRLLSPDDIKAARKWLKAHKAEKAAAKAARKARETELRKVTARGVRRRGPSVSAA